MRRPVKKLPRRVRAAPGVILKPTASEVSEQIVASHAKQINDLPTEQKAVVISALREGLRMADIARFFGEQGWLSVKEQTFVQYLQAFKRKYPEQLRGPDDETLSGLVSPLQPNLDEENNLEQLIRAMGIRLRIGMDFEKNTGILTDKMHKEFETAGNLIERLAKIRGKMTGAGRPTKDSVPLPNEAREQLRNSDRSEQAQERIATLMGRLASLVEAKSG